LRKYLKAIVAVVITAVALWLSFRKIDWGALKSSFARIQYGWLILAVANSLLGVLLLGARWRVLLIPRATVRHRDLFRMNILAQYANIIMPARLGEIVRINLGAKEPNITAPFVLGTLGAEKLLDFFVFAGLWLSVPVFLSFQQVGPGLGIAALFCLASAGIFVFFVFRPALILKAILLFSRVFPKTAIERTGRWAEQGLEAFQAFRSPRAIIFILLWTILIILNQVLTNYLVLQGARLVLPFQASLLVLLALQAGALPPAAPGRIGIYEYSVILALSVFAVPPGPALSGAVLLHLVVYLPKILLGGAFLMLWKSKQERVRGDRLESR